jgi:anthranilate synthase component 2
LEGLADGFVATRYHSLALAGDSLPEVLEATAWTDDGEVMAISHRSRPIHGVLFHPESYASDGGHQLLGNFLRIAGVRALSTV